MMFAMRMVYNPSEMDDTHPKIRRIHAEMLREAGSQRRLTMACDLTQQVLIRARCGIKRAHPEMSKRERDLLFIRVNYGRDLADRVRQCLEERRSDHAA